jgi:mono/diheme cytochrome c family protein
VIRADRSSLFEETNVMTRFVRTLATACAVAALSAVATGTPAQAQDAPPGNAENGKRVYLATGCFTCHGRAGQGGGYNQPVPSLAKTAMPYEGFKFQLRSPAKDMPAYAEVVMTDQQIADIYAFVQSLPGKRDPKDFPLLKDF